MSFIIRNIRKITDAPFNTTGGAVQYWAYAGVDALAAMLAAGYFNDMRARLKVNDVLFLTGAADAAGDFLIVRVTAVPSSGNVLVSADDDQKSVGDSRAVASTADGLTTGLLTAADAFVTVASANANNIVTLPAIADVPLGKEIWGKNGGTAFEMRTPSASTTKINGGDAHSSESVVAANATFVAKKVAADEWTLVTYAPGAVAVPVPD